MPRPRIVSIVCATALWITAASVAAQPGSWSNPLPFQYTEGQAAPRTEVRDPCIVRDGDLYYLVFTMWPFSNREEPRLDQPNQGGSPGIALYCSPDLKSWKFTTWLVKSSELPEDCPYKNRFWAPEIHKMSGRYCLIFTADNWLKKEHNPAGTWGTAGYAFVGVADRITGPYKHITYIPDAACDTSLFEDSDGKTYAVIPRYHIDLQEIDLTGLSRGHVKLLGRPQRLITAENGDIGIEAKPDYLEGPWLEQLNGRYYLFYAEIYRDQKHADWLGYWTGVAYADNVRGPWKKDPRGRLFLGGHLAVFPGPDGRRWFSYRGESNNSARGLLCVDPFQVDEAGSLQTAAPTLGRGAHLFDPRDAQLLAAPFREPSRRVSIGNGSGYLSYPEAQARLKQQPGDTLYIKPGTYSGLSLGNLSGTAAQPITVRCDPDTFFTTITPQFNAFPNVAHVRFRGFRFETYKSTCLKITGRSHDLLFRDFTLRDVSGYSFYVYDPAKVFDGTKESAFYNFRWENVLIDGKTDGAAICNLNDSWLLPFRSPLVNAFWKWKMLTGPRCGCI